ncbi:MAG TPA: ribosome maturation factor RimM [Sulfurovum sp.]|uniref:ribosome maturation factor RimM n=1 Tax=Sulfurovum sp. TaxID=1969726 RepID=UPI002F924C92
MSNDTFFIAQIGRTVGLWGDLKFHLHTDFPEQFKVGQTYKSDRGNLTVADVNLTRGTIRFTGYESVDSAKKLTNAKLYADEAQTKESCVLDEGQYFWFDMIGCEVKQGDEVLGRVEDIQRMADTDYLSIRTEEGLVNTGLPNHFLIPYIERYILEVDTEAKIVHTKDAKDILEAS